ncbi:MAG: hypothetical protein H6739_30300 [Alphaproteobacteria bacterium]|nr:hypothetical protein [Alphaproteobacteria bacterium]
MVPLQPLRIIAASMGFAQLLFFFVATQVATEPTDADVSAIGPGLAVAALGLVVMGVFVRRMQLGGLGLAWLEGGAAALRARDVDPAPVEQAKEAARSVSMRYQTSTITSYAFAESITLFGFALAFLAGDPLYMVPFLLVGLALAALWWPSGRGRASLLQPEARAALDL